MFVRSFVPNRPTRLCGRKATLNQLTTSIVQDLCESRGGRPGLSILTSLLVSVDMAIRSTAVRINATWVLIGSTAVQIVVRGFLLAQRLCE